MELVLLADFPEHASQITRWYYDEWISDIPGQSLNSVLAAISMKVSQPGPSLMVIAKNRTTLLGVAELKEREMDNYPQFTHWLGGVYVDAAARGRGIGSALVANVIEQAKSHGVETLYLQTEDLSGGLYKRHGFQPVETTSYKGRIVLVMATQLNM